MIYFDNAAYTAPLICAREAFLNAPNGNPNSSHIYGRDARQALDKAKETIAQCLDCKSEEVFLSSCASEGAAWVLNTFEEYCRHIRKSRFEHHCISDFPILHRRLDQFAIPDGTAVMLSNNETGQIFDMPKKVHPNDLILTDATAAVGHIPISFRKLGVDYLIGDAMKFGGYAGCGFVIVKEGAPLSWHHEGTPPVALICAMAEALRWHTEYMEQNISYVSMLNQRMKGLLSEGEGFRTTLDESVETSPYVLSCRFSGVSAQALVAAASAKGVAISAGSACSTGSLEPSRVLLASGLTEEQALETIRISFSHESRLDDVEDAARIILGCVKALSNM